MKKIDLTKLRTRETQKSIKKDSSDPRFLNYFDLKDNEMMTIRLLPDAGESGSFYVEYSTHGPGFKNLAVPSIPCSNNWGERCPVCAKSYELYKAGNKESELWRKKTKYIAQCLVVDAPIEVPANPDGGVVKLLNMPFQMYDRTIEGILNGTVDDPFDLEIGNNFVIKKTKKGEFNQYDKSYWQPKPTQISVEYLEALSDTVANPMYDLSLEIPERVDLSELTEWIAKVEAIVGVDPENSEAEAPKKTSVAEMMKKAAPGVKKTEETPLETKTAVAEEPTAKVGKTAKELLAALKK